jgi:hypothetical protein
MPNQVNDGFSVPDPEALQSEAAAQSAKAEDRINVVLESSRDALMQIRGVVMVGEGQDEVGQPAIVVGVKDQHSMQSIPKTVDGIRIVTTVIGEVDAL